MAVACVVAAMPFVSSCMSNTDRELKTVEHIQESATLSAFELHSFVTDTGVYKYEFETPELHQYDNVEKPYTDFPQGLRFVMYASGGKVVSSRISCNNARYHKSENLWELNHDVEAMTQKGDILNTEQLFWNTETRRIYSEKFVKITTKNQVITGRGFESDDQLSKYEIRRPGGQIDVEQ